MQPLLVVETAGYQGTREQGSSRSCRCAARWEGSGRAAGSGTGLPCRQSRSWGLRPSELGCCSQQGSRTAYKYEVGPAHFGSKSEFTMHPNPREKGYRSQVVAVLTASRCGGEGNALPEWTHVVVVAGVTNCRSRAAAAPALSGPHALCAPAWEPQLQLLAPDPQLPTPARAGCEFEHPQLLVGTAWT